MVIARFLLSASFKACIPRVHCIILFLGHSELRYFREDHDLEYG